MGCDFEPKTGPKARRHKIDSACPPASRKKIQTGICPRSRFHFLGFRPAHWPDFSNRKCKMDLTLFVPNQLFREKSQSTKNLTFLRRCRGKTRFCSTSTRGVEKNRSFHFVENAFSSCFFPDIMPFCAQSPLVDPQPLDQRALGTKIFGRTFPKILESSFFQRCLKLCLSRLEL